MQRSFNHQIGDCGADVIAPAVARHTADSAEAMCALQRLCCSEATLERPGGPREEQGLTSLKGKAFLQRGAVWPASPGDLPYLAAREGPFLAASPGAHAWDLVRFSSPSVLGQ